MKKILFVISYQALNKLSECLDDLVDASDISRGDHDDDDFRLEIFTELLKTASTKENISEASDKYRAALKAGDKIGLTSLESCLRPEPKVVEKLKASNSKHPAFSDCVEVKETKLQGRFTVAARDIEPGKKVLRL